MSDQTSQRPFSNDSLDLASMYLGSSVAGRAHSVGLRLSEEHGGNRKGTLALDPNVCTLDDWGDRRGCTKMAIRQLEVMTTRMRTLDPTGHRRVLHEMTSDGFEQEKVNLIEHAAAGSWTLVYSIEGAGRWAIPLFDAKLLASDPAGTIIMRYGVPMRAVLERGDVDEMRSEIATVRSALEALEATPALRSSRTIGDDHISDVKAALAELEAAVAELDA